MGDLNKLLNAAGLAANFAPSNPKNNHVNALHVMLKVKQAYALTRGDFDGTQKSDEVLDEMISILILRDDIRKLYIKRYRIDNGDLLSIITGIRCAYEHSINGVIPKVKLAYVYPNPCVAKGTDNLVVNNLNVVNAAVLDTFDGEFYQVNLFSRGGGFNIEIQTIDDTAVAVE